jgi:hypothetical protein
MAANIIGRYEQGALTGARLQAAINEAMTDLAADKGELAKIGISSTQLRVAHFTVEQEGGFIAEGILIAIAIGAGSNLTADAAKALWSAVLKRVKHDRGDDAVGAEVLAEPEGEDR